MRAALHAVVFLPLLGLCGCEDRASVQAASQYRQVVSIPAVPLVFAPGVAVPDQPSRARLRQLHDTMPAESVPVLHGDGTLTAARVRVVSTMLARPVVVVPVAAGILTANTALLDVPVRPGILADACRGPGVQNVGDLWPGDDVREPVRLPAGCATEATLAAQVSQRADLLTGRELGPAASSPYADAIERYYARNAAPQPRGGQSGSGGSGSGSGDVEGQASSPGNPLLGGMPSPAK